MRLPRKGLGLEKDEPTQALQMGVPAAESTLRLKREDMALEEPTVALKAGVPAAESTLRLKREDMALEEPTQAIERPKLRTAMEVIDEATLVDTPAAKPSVMLPDASDIPSWEETTQLFMPPPSGHGDATVHIPRPAEPSPAPVDPSDSMDETFPKLSLPVLQEPPMQATNLMLVSHIAQTEEETLVLPDMQELDELPNAMRATMVMPVLEAPAAAIEPEPMEATVVMHAEPPAAPMARTMVMPMPMLEAPAAAIEPEPMEATVIMKVEPPAHPAAQVRTQIMPVMEKPEDRHEPVPMEATVVLPTEPSAAPAPMEKTMVMPMLEAPAATLAPEPMEATVVLPVEPPAEAPTESPLHPTMILPVPLEEPSAYLTRQGQSPWPPSNESAEPSPASTQLMSESLLCKAMEATNSETDSALAPIPPEVTAMADDSPLAKAAGLSTQPGLMQPGTINPDRTVATSVGMAVTPATLLMPIQVPLEPTVPVHRPQPARTPAATAHAPRTSQPMARPLEPLASKPEPESAEPHVPNAAVPPPSVPGYPDRQLHVPAPEPKFQTKPIEKIGGPERPASQLRAVSHAYPAMAPQPEVTHESPSKIWMPAAIAVLLLIIGGIYFAFFRPSLKSNSPLVSSPHQTTEPSLPVPASMQGTLDQAKAGDSKAMQMLGVSFYYGLNIPPNKAEGLRWMRKAAAAGNEKAKSDLRQMEAGDR